MVDDNSTGAPDTETETGSRNRLSGTWVVDCDRSRSVEEPAGADKPVGHPDGDRSAIGPPFKPARAAVRFDTASDTEA